MKEKFLRMKKVTSTALFALLMALVAPSAMNAQKTLPYGYGFENNDLASEGWTVLNESSANASEFGTTTAAAYNGDYGFRFSSYNRDYTSYDQYLISPELSASNAIALQFYYRAYSTSGTETFKVGYSATDAEISSFSFGSEISTNSTNWTLSEVFGFPENTKYIAVYYYSDYQYRLFVDDFNFLELTDYCVPTPTQVDGNGISYVTFGTGEEVVNNDTPKAGYANYSNLVGGIQAGVESTVAITYATGYTYGTLIWVDFDNSLTFEDDEIVYMGTSAEDNPTTLEAVFTIPATQTIGDYRMRIGGADMYYDSFIGGDVTAPHDPCYSGQYAAFQDYTLRVNEAPFCLPPTNLEVSESAPRSVQVSWNENEGTAWQVAHSTDATADPDDCIVNPTEPATTPSYEMTSLAIDVDHYFWVRSYCSETEQSQWLGPVSIYVGYCVPAPTQVDGNGISNVTFGTGEEVVNNDTPKAGYANYSNLVGGIQAGVESTVAITYATGYTYGTLIWVDFDNSLTFEDDEIVYMGTSVEDNPTTLEAVFTIPATQAVGDYHMRIGGADMYYDSFIGGDVTAPHDPCYSGQYAAFQDYTLRVNEAPSCIPPTHLETQNITDTSVTLSWTVNGTEEAWEIEYREEGETEWQTMTAYENPYTLEGLSEQTTYEVRVSAVCTGSTTPTLAITFTTDCIAYEISMDNPLFEDFEGYTGTTYNAEGVIPTCWKNYSESSILPHITGIGDYHYVHSGTNTLYFYGAANTNSYVALPKVSNDLNGLCISFWMQTESATNGSLSLGYVSNDDDDFSTFEEIATFDNHSNSMVLCGVYLSDIPDIADRLAFRWTYSGSSWYGCCIDDVEISMGINIFNGIESNDWNTAANWSNNSVPTATDKVLINADAVINTEVEINEIAMGTGSITIGGRGQLKHNNEGVQATVQRTISTYIGENDNYYLIASPFANDLAINNPDQANLITNNYDLYLFDQYYDLEWRNYKNDEFTTLSNGIGYLYANSGEEGQTTYTINLSGELKPSNTDKSVDLDYNNVVFAGWNLVGNPFACNAYIGQDFYRLGKDGVDATPASGAIAPMEGIFVKATGTNQSVTFSRNEPEGNGNKGTLNVNVMSKGNRVDLARVRFGVGQDLEKFQINPNHTKVVIPQGGKDYAVAYSESGTGEMPISFKAETNGTYTLDFSNEEVTFSYLHLIDNLAGIDVDLLQTPTYTFEAKTTDYASRFRLVFNAEDGPSTGSGTFAFVIDGNIIVNGEGILQVVDAMGRVIIQGDAMNRVSTSGITSGVYVLRLVNGNNVKTQKIVIR